MIHTISKLDTKRQKKETMEREGEKKKKNKRERGENGGEPFFVSRVHLLHLSIWFLLFSEPSFPTLSYLSFPFIFSYLNLCVSRRKREEKRRE